MSDGFGVPLGSPVDGALVVQDLSGGDVALSALIGGQPTLVLFYRGGWCPYCNGQLRDLSAAWPTFQAAGLGVVAVSVDSPTAAGATSASWEIPFPVVSDSQLVVHDAFNVVVRLEPRMQRRYIGYGIDLEGASGRTDAAIGVPSMFVVKGGEVVWAHVDVDYKVRPTPADALAAIRTAGVL